MMEPCSCGVPRSAHDPQENRARRAAPTRHDRASLFLIGYTMSNYKRAREREGSARGMVRHEVIIRIRPEINEEVSERVIMEVVTLLKDIPGVVSVRYGTNQAPEYRHLMLEVLLPSESTLQRFGRHPLHV